MSNKFNLPFHFFSPGEVKKNVFKNKQEQEQTKEQNDLNPIKSITELKKRHEGYEVGSVIGCGTYAKVRLGKSRKTNETVAIKIIRKNEAPKEFTSKFLPRELSIIRNLNHKNIIKVFDIIHELNRTYIIMELAREGDLLRFINTKGRQIEKVSKLIYCQIMMGLAYLHRNHVSHRDLKCENILIDRDNTIKLTDFGFATYSPPDLLLSTFCGSYAYACPEILQAKIYRGHEADIWSSGIVLFALLCGYLPFSDNEAGKIMKQIRRPLRFPGDLSVEARHLLKGILFEDPNDRFKMKDIETHAWMKNIENNNILN